MRYWKVSLLHEGRTAREWHVRTEVLTVGSHGSNKVRLPPPVEPFAIQLSELAEAEIREVGPYLLRIEDETDQRNAMWSEARSRVEDAVSAAKIAPREAPVPVKAAVAACTLLGLTNLVASLVVDGRLGVLRAYEKSRPEIAMVASSAPIEAPAPRFESVDAGLERPVDIDVAAPTRKAALLFASPFSERREARSIVAITRTTQVPASHASPTWDGAMVAAATEDPANGSMPSDWFASPPARYRAPWPDAPVPPH